MGHIWVKEGEQHIAYLNLIPIPELYRLINPLIVKIRAVGAAHILHVNTPAIAANLGMFTGNPLTRDNNIVFDSATNDRVIVLQRVLPSCGVY
jgi:hypothetical protein